MVARYTPQASPNLNRKPDDVFKIQEYVKTELESIARSLESQVFLQLTTMYVEPEKPREGMIVLADGTQWDPGSGAGFYGYVGGAWSFLG